VNLPDLSQIYNTINWYKNNRDHSGGGIFMLLPTEISEQFPLDGKSEEDNSPPHITVIYISPVIGFEDKIKTFTLEICQQFKPFKVKLGKPKKFINDKEQTIIHSPILSSKLVKFHNFLKEKMLANHIPISLKYPEFKPHVTIEYINSGEEPKYNKLKPEGEWIVDSVWLWGGEEPYMIYLGN